jgi:hypothetical protein
MKKFTDIDQFLRACGYWTGPHDSRYGYYPTVAPISFGMREKQQFTDIGRLVVLYQDYVNQLVTQNGISQPKDHFGALIQRIAKHASSGLAIKQTSQRVPICKVDLIYSKEGLRIAEIDAYNPRGMLYAVLLSNLYEISSPISDKIALQVKEKKTSWIFANHERYYHNVLRATQYLLEKNKNVSLQIHNSNELITSPNHFIMVPWGLRTPNEVRVRTMLEEHSHKGNCWYPVAPWLSSKSFLGVLGHQVRDASCSKELAELTKQFIPETFLVHHKMVDVSRSMSDFVLKPTVSSGHKGVTRDQADLSSLLGKTPSHILQQFSEPQPVNIPFYSKEGVEQRADFFLRVTAYYDDLGNFLEAEITGRNEWLVHGATDCIQGPVILA